MVFKFVTNNIILFTNNINKTIIHLLIAFKRNMV